MTVLARQGRFVHQVLISILKQADIESAKCGVGFFGGQVIEALAEYRLGGQHLQAAGIFEKAILAVEIDIIDQGLIRGVSNESLWEKRKRRKRGRKILRRKAKKASPPGHEIQDRPPEVANREEFGHWEIDLIVSGKDGCGALLTLVERKTRRMILRNLADKTQEAVLHALAQIERSMRAKAFRVAFKTITADNGSEFLDVMGLERSNDETGNRTRWYYAHPFASRERDSNENGNRMIRRFIPKGSDLSRIAEETIQQAEDRINRYPRKI